jgi:hypothetical protein
MRCPLWSLTQDLITEKGVCVAPDQYRALCSCVAIPVPKSGDHWLLEIVITTTTENMHGLCMYSSCTNQLAALGQEVSAVWVLRTMTVHAELIVCQTPITSSNHQQWSCCICHHARNAGSSACRLDKNLLAIPCRSHCN